MEIWAFPMDLNRWGAGGALVKMDGYPSSGNSTLVYFSCEDCSTQISLIDPVCAFGSADTFRISAWEPRFLSDFAPQGKTR
jgi:hypothetical protein